MAKWFLTFAFLAIGLCLPAASAQPTPTYFTGNNNTGTDFWMSFLPAWPVAGGINNVKIYVTSTVETDVFLEVKSEGYIKVKKTKPNDIIEFILPVTVAQPYFKTDRDPTPPEQVYREHAVHVYSKDPIICYGVTRYQYTSDSYMAVPTSALGTEYIISSFGDVGDNGTSFGQAMPSEAAIIAPFDNTKVVFTLGGNAVTKTPGGMKPGESKIVTLNKGDLFFVASFGHTADLSGSKVVASKPVSIVSGNYCAYIPLDVAACDLLMEMEIPTHTWGKSYVVAKTFGRQKNSYIKVMAKEPNTKVYCDGQHIATIETAGGIEGIGYVNRRIAEGAPKSYVVTADKPICVTQFNTGQQDDNISSDPFQMVLPPVEQFKNELTFCTPDIGDGSGFTRNYVNVVFELDSLGGMPLELEWAMVDNGKIVWNKFGERFGFFFESFTVGINGKKFGMKTVQLPRAGVYKIRSAYQCGATTYGFSDYDSYGMPVGMYLEDLTLQDETAPVATFTVGECDGAVNNGSVSDSSAPGKYSGLAKVAMLQESFNYSFELTPFIPGATAKATTWKLAVVDYSKTAKAVLLFTDRAGNTRIDSVEYYPNGNGFPRTQANLGAVKLEEVTTQTITLRNQGMRPTAIDTLYLRDNKAFSIVSLPTFPVVVPPNGTLEVVIRYSPSADETPIAQHTDDLIAKTKCAAAATIATVTGKGVAALIAIADRDFGKHAIGTITCANISIANNGDIALVITDVNGLDAPFSIPDLALPLTVAPKQAAILQVCFVPTETQKYVKELLFTSNADGPDAVCMIYGEGIIATDVPSEYQASNALECRPNPASDDMSVSYTLPTPGLVRIELYGVDGRLAKVLYEGVQQAGFHSVQTSVAELAAGGYVCRLVLPSGVQTHKVTLAR